MTSKPNVKIIRFTKGFKSVIGELYIDDEFFCYTLEREWLDNKKDISCIPPGIYDCKPYSSEKYPSVTEITDVEGRNKILIHQGNYYWDIEGCILVGDRYEKLAIAIEKRTGAVYNSVKTLKRFFDKAGREFKLEIIDNVNFDTNLAIKPKNKMIPMIPLAINGAISLIKIFAPSIVNRFKRTGKNLVENTAEKLIKKAEKKLGFKITDQKSAEKARDQLDSKDLLDLEKLALKTDAKMFSDELKFGEDLSKTPKDDVVTYIIGLIVLFYVVAGYFDYERAIQSVKVVAMLLGTTFGVVFAVAFISAVGGRRLLNKVVDKFLR